MKIGARRQRVVVLVSKVGGSENGGSDRSQDGGRGVPGAEAAGSCSLAVSLCRLWEKRELQVPAGGARGWWRGPCVRLEEPESRGERAHSDCGHLRLLSHHLLADLPTSTRAQRGSGPSFVVRT